MLWDGGECDALRVAVADGGWSGCLGLSFTAGLAGLPDLLLCSLGFICTLLLFEVSALVDPLKRAGA